MIRNKTIALGLLAFPALALAQVGPNPAVPGGSQSPSIGGSTDAMTAPQDARIGARASGNILDRTVDTRASGDVDTDADRAGPAASTTGGSDANGTATSTETRTTTRTKSMERRRR